MVWYTGLLVVGAVVVILLCVARIRKGRQRRKSILNHLDGVVGRRRD
jgi:hypothetical protein